MYMDTMIRHAATIITVFLLSVIVYSRCLAPALGGSCTSITGRHVYDCVARECLKCGTPVENSTTVVGGGRRIGVAVEGVPANCSFDPVTSTLTCRPDTSTCTIETCSHPCDSCLAIYQKRPGDPLDGDAWIFFSRCFPLEVHAWKPNCTSNGIFHADRCFSRHKFDANQRESIVSGEMGFPALSCRCYELNCTAEMAGIEFEFFESPTFANPVLSLSLSLSPPPSPLRLCSWALSISLLLFSLSLFPINANAK